ncbi:zinc-finger of acetyl-transferase ESCO [Teratosphaeria destructans]|uniref:Zinc-finger of acetyl-transferase ESCO n=1 Tax=Teratosphaeria destructans TaxID=418781 RepID=A0A9W7SNQ1_9PEZI|nr:zinc-finger of acetyl-transferase ESCO [Teratosphaeria destructans]
MLTSENTAPTSSPRRHKPLFSSDAPLRPSSPPSSPPGFPWEYQQPSNPSSHQTDSSLTGVKNAFSIMAGGKRKALDSVSDNVRPVKRAASKPTGTKNKSKSFTQMQISLGQKVQKTCAQCGMEYNVSSTEDRKLHDKYHKQNTDGCDVGKDFVKNAREGSVLKGTKDGDSICAVDCDDKPGRKKRAQAALDIVQRELGAVPIPGKELWSVQEHNDGRPRFRVYMYIRRTKCIGVLLAEGMDGREAYKVVEPIDSIIETAEAKQTLQTSATEESEAAVEIKATLEDRPIAISGIINVARLGISRIWTSPEHRSQNIATRLLDAAVEHHNRCVEERKIVAAAKESENKQQEVDAVKSLNLEEVEKVRSKEDVAFSHPRPWERCWRGNGPGSFPQARKGKPE